MNAFSKKILSAFIELPADEKPVYKALKRTGTMPLPPVENQPITEADHKFAEHFAQLFAEANRPGPGYYEFSKMTEAMQIIADEKARYSAAFAGLQVQGLNKQKLLASAQQYIDLLDADAVAFQVTIDEALKEKVGAKKAAIEAAKIELQQLSQQIISLQQQVAAWTDEIAEAEVKISSRAAGYVHTMESYKAKLLQDRDKIAQHII